MKPSTCLVALAAAALILADAPAVAQAGSAPPPPRTEAQGSGGASNAPPAAAAPPLTAMSGFKITTKSSDAIFRIGASAGPTSPEMLKRGGTMFRAAGNALTAIDVGMCLYDKAYADALRKSAAWGINQALAAGCALTGPLVVHCGIALTVAQVCSEAAFGTSLGGLAVKGGEAALDGAASLLAEAQSRQQAMRAAQRTRFGSTESQNGSYATTTSYQAAPYSPAYDSYDDSGALLGALMVGVATAAVASPIAPSQAPSAAASLPPPDDGPSCEDELAVDPYACNR